MKGFSRIVLSWIPLAIAIVGLCGLVSVTVQQNYRQSLNDPQIQMAEDAAAALSSGAQVAQVVPTNKVDIATSLSPWLAVYNNDGVYLSSNGALSGVPPQIPKGVFLAALNSGGKDTNEPNEDRVTWQPQNNVRQAIVVVYTGSGYVVAGRNMREVENREHDLSSMVVLAMLVLLIATFVAKIFVAWIKPRR